MQLIEIQRRTVGTLGFANRSARFEQEMRGARKEMPRRRLSPAHKTTGEKSALGRPGSFAQMLADTTDWLVSLPSLRVRFGESEHATRFERKSAVYRLSECRR